MWSTLVHSIAVVKWLKQDRENEKKKHTKKKFTSIGAQVFKLICMCLCVNSIHWNKTTKESSTEFGLDRF